MTAGLREALHAAVPQRVKCRNSQPYWHSNMDLLAMAIWAKHGEDKAFAAMREVCQDADGLMMRVSELCSGDPQKAIDAHRMAMAKIKQGARGLGEFITL